MDFGRMLQSCGVIGSIDTLVVLRKFLGATSCDVNYGGPPRPAKNLKLTTLMKAWLGLDPEKAHAALYGASVPILLLWDLLGIIPQRLLSS
jgi:hypothetical protein